MFIILFIVSFDYFSYNHDTKNMNLHVLKCLGSGCGQEAIGGFVQILIRFTRIHAPFKFARALEFSFITI